MPLAKVKAYYRILDEPFYIKAFTTSYPVDLGQIDVFSLDLDTLWIAERLVMVFLLESRKAFAFLESITDGSIQIFEGLLLGLRMNEFEKGCAFLALHTLQLIGHSHIARMLYTTIQSLFNFSKGLIPNQPSSCLGHPNSLLRCRIESKLEGFAKEHGFSSLYPMQENTSWSKDVSIALRTGRHCVFLMHIHLVFVTKYRRKVFTKKIIEDPREIFDGVCQSFEAELTEFKGEGVRVHLLVIYPPKVQVSKLVNSLKTASLRVIRKKGCPSVEKALWGGALWSPSYFAGSCGGSPIGTVKRYIQEQESPT